MVSDLNPPKTDDPLVERLVDILRRADATWDGCGNPYIIQAHAVIRELQLRQEWTWTWPRTNEPDTEWGYGLIVDTREEAVIEGDGRSRPAHRYVTDWIATDE